jgi:hypothetical protein
MVEKAMVNELGCLEVAGTPVGLVRANAIVASGKGGRRYKQEKPTRHSGGGLADAASENQTWLTSPADRDTQLPL